MSNRKQCLYLSILGLLVVCSCQILSCQQPVAYVQPVAVGQVQSVAPQQQYQIIQDPNTGIQQAVFYDNGVQMMLELSLFNSMMNSGGYGYVIHHYHDYPSYRTYNSRSYSSWRTVSRGSYNTYKPAGSLRSTGGSVPAFRNTSTPAYRSTSTPTFRSSASTPAFRSSSTPSRSSSGGSFRRH